MRSTRTRRARRSTSTDCWRSASAPRRRPDGQLRQVTALIAAAGSGARLGAGGPKALVNVAGRPLIAWCLEAFGRASTIGRVVVAAPAGYEGEVAAAAGPEPLVVAGGASRSESVVAALAQAGSELVAVHDAARPLVAPDLIDALVARLAAEPDAAGVIAATPIVDTVKRVDETLEIVATERREGLWAAQTPQVFRAAALRSALDAFPERLAAATDDAMLVEWAGGRVLVEPARAENPKLTTPADLERIELLLRSR